MKILIATYGSRGDVQPYVALGKGLQNAGHHVTLGTSERFRDFVENHGLEYGYMNDGLLSIIDTDVCANIRAPFYCAAAPEAGRMVQPFEL